MSVSLRRRPDRWVMQSTRLIGLTEQHFSCLIMRKMIPEINTSYRPTLTVMDGIDAFEYKESLHGNEADR